MRTAGRPDEITDGSSPRVARGRVAIGGRPLGDVLEFMRLVWGIAHGLQSVSKRMNRRLGVTGPQRLVLRVVGRQPGISAGDLARVLCVHPSTLTGILRRLQKRGWISRATDPSDGRRSVLILTAAGVRMNRPLAGTVENAARRALDQLTPHQVAAAGQALSVLALELERET